MLYISSDHRGFGLKNKLIEFLNNAKIEHKDLGAFVYGPDDDLPVFASSVAEKVSKNSKKNKGIVICGSGVGSSIICNKFKKVRAALCLTVNVAKESREHHDANVLCLAAELTDPSIAWMIVKKWLTTGSPTKQRYIKRMKMLEKIEKDNFK